MILKSITTSKEVVGVLGVRGSKMGCGSSAVEQNQKDIRAKSTRKDQLNFDKFKDIDQHARSVNIQLFSAYEFKFSV